MNPERDHSDDIRVMKLILEDLLMAAGRLHAWMSAEHADQAPRAWQRGKSAEVADCLRRGVERINTLRDENGDLR